MADRFTNRLSKAIQGSITFLLIFFSIIPFSSALAQVSPTLSLNPSAGDPSAVSGTLSGSGWCGPAEFNVVGENVFGSASSDEAGNLSGRFSVSGQAGETVTIEVNGSCPGRGAPISSRANFTFYTPRSQPTSTTVVSTPTSPPPTSKIAPSATLVPSLIPTKPSKVTLPPLLISTPTPTPETEPVLPVQATLSGNTFLKVLRKKWRVLSTG